MFRGTAIGDRPWRPIYPHLPRIAELPMSAPHWKQWIKAPCVKAWAEMLIVGSVATAAAAQELSPLQTVELLHKAMTAADAATAAALLHADYHGVSLQGPLEQRRVYVEARDKVLSDIAAVTGRSASSRPAHRPTRMEWPTCGRDTSSITRAHRITAVTNPTACCAIAEPGRSSASPTRTMR